ncbi:unnamed protein product [Calicophoron daubneyi]|uniref:Uncharacterized protein n=1 Tax=Calicophoron daubneyi TaxID=300641 RepID=A0AAV2TJW1_CALDB
MTRNFVVAVRMNRLYKDLRQLKRRSRMERLAKFGFMQFSTRRHDRIHSVEQGWIKTRIKDRVLGTADNSIKETNNEILPTQPTTSKDQSSIVNLPAILEEKQSNSLFIRLLPETEISTEEQNPIIQALRKPSEDRLLPREDIVQWINSITEVNPEHVLPDFDDDDKDVPAIPPIVEQNQRKRQTKTKFPSIIDHNRAKLTLSAPGTGEPLIAYAWIGNPYIAASQTKASLRCQPGRTGAKAEQFLKPVPLPKPVLVRYPPPTSRVPYTMKKTLDREKEIFRECVTRVLRFENSLDAFKGGHSVPVAVDLLLKLF